MSQPPAVFSWAWKLLSPFLAEATRAKVSVVSPRSQPPHWRDYGDAPLSAMRPDSLPISLGGTLSQPVAPMHFVKAC